MKQAALFAVAFMGWLGSAEAAVITQTSPSILRQGQGHFVETFQQFDPALGTLQAVGVSLVGTLAHSATFEPSTPGCPTCGSFAQIFWSTGVTFNAPGFPVRAFSSSDFVVLINVGGGLDSFVDTLDPFSFVADINYLEWATLGIGDYIGNGTVDVVADVSADSDVCTDFGIRPTCSASFDLPVSLIYVYTPVPAPASAFGLLVGLAGLLAYRRLRA